MNIELRIVHVNTRLQEKIVKYGYNLIPGTAQRFFIVITDTYVFDVVLY